MSVTLRGGPQQDEWFALPYTEHVLKQLKTTVAEAVAGLLRSCADSTDPDVARAYGRYIAVQQLEVDLTRKEIKTEDE
jgi:hypothetical protein